MNRNTAQNNINEFLRYLQACAGHDAPFDLKAHLPRINKLLYDFDNSTESEWKEYHVGCGLCGSLACRGTCFK